MDCCTQLVLIIILTTGIISAQPTGGSNLSQPTGDTASLTLESVVDSGKIANDTIIPSPGERQDSLSAQQHPATHGGQLAAPTTVSVGTTHKSVIDYLMDLAVGGNYAKLYKVEPRDIAIATKGATSFTLGIKIFPEAMTGWFAGFSLRSSSLKFQTSMTPIFMNEMKNTITSSETLNYLALPVCIGKRFERWFAIPYIYGSIEPAWLTGASRRTKNEIHITFPDNSQLNKVEITDSLVTNERERVQCFAGLGVGVEIPYGYGAVYCDAALNYAIMEMKCGRTSPLQKSRSLLYIPLTIGVRFYL